MAKYFFLFYFIVFYPVLAQSDSSSIELGTVTVNAFQSNRPEAEVAVSMLKLKTKELQRFENDGFLNALNRYPGVRIEERSPGSYRIAIRGSSVRSPFGVRNVKVYWNGIPLTDANNVSYFNQLDLNSFDDIEIIKGPAASVYGAGIGGVILLHNNDAKVFSSYKNEIKLAGSFGSYNTPYGSATYTHAGPKSNTFLQVNALHSDGYRQQSMLDRKNLNFRTSLFLSDKNSLHIFGFVGDLAYQTPGGLNFAQKEANPSQARPGTQFTPGAVEQKAAIYQKMYAIGVSDDFKISNNWDASLSLFGNFSNLQNPFITNFEKRDQSNYGIRNTHNFKWGSFMSLTAGFEFQTSNSAFDVFDNNKGETGNRQFKEDVKAIQGLVFAQSDLQISPSSILTLGLSHNSQIYDYAREGGQAIRDRSGVPLMPRISFLQKVQNHHSFFLTYSAGFSAPTVQEFTSVFAVTDAPILNAERANNLELGYKARWSKLQIDWSLYQQNMTNALVKSFQTSGGVDVFANVGEVTQKGLEFMLQYSPVISSFLKADISFAADLKDYKYLDYRSLDVVFDGNELPSVAPSTYNLGFDLQSKAGLYLTNNVLRSSAIPLNDANTVYASKYVLYNARLGWRCQGKHTSLNFYVGAQNILDQKYSLGDDVNAFGSRFFNPAAPRNYNLGFALAQHF